MAEPVVEAKDVLAGGFHLLDARPEADYRAGHVAGAVRVSPADWDRIIKGGNGGIGSVEDWNAAIGAVGVDGSRLVAIYDDGKATDAARIWFILQYFGVPAAVVNGNWPALRAALGDRLQTAASEPVAAAFSGRPGAGAVGFKQRGDLREELGSGVQVFDARTQAEYDGKDVRNNPRGGHLPGAVRVGHTDLLDGSGRLLDAAALRQLLGKAGFASGKPIVTHCEGGGRAALAALAAVRAGYTGVHNYYLSFADWARDDTCPVVREQQ